MTLLYANNLDFATIESVTSQDDDEITWDTKQNRQAVFFEVQRNSPQQFTEVDDRAQDIIAVLGTLSVRPVFQSNHFILTFPSGVRGI